jgi:dihydrofolate reductase
MGLVKCHIAVSLDGYAAGPNQRLEEPLGDGGEDLHKWAFAAMSWQEQHGRSGGEDNADSKVIAAATRDVGAVVMGRGMFGGGPGPWADDPPWTGWWGEDPPFHVPVFVLTHHPREVLVLEGGNSFTFVTEGIESAIAQAKEAAGSSHVNIGGGAATIQQALKAGLLDELQVNQVPVVLGGGSRLLDGVGPGDATFELAGVVDSPTVTHLTYRVVR